MGKIAFVFSGQGAQYSGMGKELFDCSSMAKSVFDISDSIRPGTSKQCFFGTAEELSVTINTQPCIYSVDLAAAMALKEAGVMPEAVAGFSLGEIAALTFAGAFSLADGFKFVCKRAEVMNAAAEKTKGSMAAILKLTDEQVKELCESVKNVYPVNFNCPGQVVVAGEKEAVATLSDLAKEKGGRAVPLAVSGGFHSPLMNKASEEIEKELENYNISALTLPVYANKTAMPYGDNIKELIANQVNSPVLWQGTITNMVKDGFDTFVEVGPGKVLCGLIKKIAPEANIFNVENNESLQYTIDSLNERKMS